MIIREWRGRARPALSGVYINHFRGRVVPELSGVPGFRGACLTLRRTGDFFEFLVLTRWESMDAIRRFAGSDVEKAVVEPAAQVALASFDAYVRHYEVLEEVSSEVTHATEPEGLPASILPHHSSSEATGARGD